MRAGWIALTLATLLGGCGNDYHPEFHPQSSYSYSQSVSEPVTIFNSGSQTPAMSPPLGGAGARSRTDPARVLVLQGKHLDRPAVVVGVVDAHEEMGKHEAALWSLKAKAAQLGADAVVGVEFHHGEGEGEPTHLSGLAVQFVRAVPYPVE
jgi:hypothetical protein